MNAEVDVLALRTSSETRNRLPRSGHPQSEEHRRTRRRFVLVSAEKVGRELHTFGQMLLNVFESLVCGSDFTSQADRI